ncbi:uncharacterized protein [Bombus fervidus]|uniref:uncharacterized protein n=1 Tax=Bombus fervidus TaxID=203811 RepID=UPI003AB22712
MFENVSPDLKDEYYRDDEFIEEFEHKPLLICIPKVEPLCSSTTDLIEDTLNVGGEVTPIPSTVPYKIKDPIILLERCDKIWETLKVIKNVQGTAKIDTSNALPSEITTSKPLYIEYQPVLGNNNTELPNFKFYVKSKKKLFHCSICGRQYTENRRLRYHSEKIHGIYIAPRRHLKNPDKVKEKDPNIVEKEEDNSEKVSLKKSENKLHTEASLLQYVSLSNNNNTVVPNLHSRRSKSNSLVCNNNDIHINGTTQNEQEKKLTKEVRQNEKVISTRNSIALSTCTLCQQVVRNIRKHLTDYHKIESPDFMLKNLNKTCTVLKSNKLKRKFSSDENEIVGKVIRKEHDIQNKRRKLCRKRGQSHRQCDICLGIYTMRSFYEHIRIHRSRGETKENFHLSRNRYFNSPIYLQSKFGSMHMSFEHTNKDNSEFHKNKEKIVQNGNNSNNMSDIKYYDKHKHTCLCGRVFRNPYTLFMHKKTCTFTNDVNQPIIESNVNRKSRYDTRSGSGRDSGLGINITIKKKNDSYEIIDKDNTSEDNITRLQLQDLNHPKDFNVSNDVLKLSKYSEKHSILKIQSGDENIDIDIEEVSQTNSCNDIISGSSSEIVSNLCKEEKQQEIKTEPNNIFYKMNVKSKFGKQSNSVTVNFAKRFNICVCGSKFYTKKALEIHTNKHHSRSQLLCGYCKISLPNAIAWNKHWCSVNEGKRFIFVPMELKCHHCSDILNTYKKFDEHIKHKHSDPVVPFQCFYCSKRFSNITSRKMHFDADHEVTTCSICNNKCDDVMKSRHKAYHYGLGFPCHYCKRTYGSKNYLLRHMRRVPHHSLLSSMESIMN